MTETRMADADLRDQIARLEADIEQLADGLDRCRKAMLLSKIAIAGGGICVLAYFLVPIGFDPTILIGALAAIIGGVVILGSNASTSEQNMAAMKDAEACKAELIGHDQSSGGGCPAGWTFTLIRTRSPPPTNDDEQRERRSLGLKLWVGRRHDKNFEPRPARWSLLVGGEGAKSCGPNGTPQPR